MIKYLFSIDTKYFVIIFIGWTCAILFLLLSDGSQEPSLFSHIPHLDKLVHFSLFLIWTLLLTLSSTRLTAVVMLVALVLFAGATEYLQQFVIYRSPDIYDAFVDVLGGVIGYYAIKHVKKSR